MINKNRIKRNTLLLLIIVLSNVCFSQIKFKLIDGRPPQTYRPPKANILTLKSSTTNILNTVPAYRWTYGCTPTSVGMLIAYYNRLGYTNLNYDPYIYAPMDNSQWGSSFENQGEDPLIATRNGLNGRITRGHVNDYYISYGSTDPDPYSTGGWSEHTPDCIADYLGTSQYKNTYSNSENSILHVNDGGTLTYYDMSGTQYTGTNSPRSCEFGIKAFIESKNYIVSDCYTQVVDGYVENGVTATNGFTYQNFKDEINNNHPVLIQLAGHTMVGIGYSNSLDGDNLIYVRDTWSYDVNSMIWGGTYPSSPTTTIQMYAVTVVHISSKPQGPPVCIDCHYPGAPNAPTLNSIAYNCSNNSIKLSWTPSSIGSTPQYYAIYRCPSTRIMTNKDKIGNTAQLSYSDFNFTADANLSYTYAIAAINNTGEGLNSNQKTVSLAPCTNTNVFNTNINTTATYKCSNINISNTSVNNNSSATFNYGNSVTIYSDFNVGLGSTLIIQEQ